MKKKGIIALALTAALALGALTGCGNTTAKETTGSTDAAAETAKASETADSEAAGSETAVSGETRVVKLGLTGVIYEDIWNPIKEELAKEGRLVWKEKEYDREDLYDADLVLSATNNEKVNNDVYSACKCLGISVNTASNRMKCDFYFPSILQKEETVIGLNSAGNPAKTKNVRKEMQKWIEEAGEKHE